MLIRVELGCELTNLFQTGKQKMYGERRLCLKEGGEEHICSAQRKFNYLGKMRLCSKPGLPQSRVVRRMKAYLRFN